MEQLPLRGSPSAGDGSADATISTVLPSDVGPGGEAAAAVSGVEDGGSCLLSFSGAARVAGRMLAHELRTFETDTEVVTAAKQRWSARLMGSEGSHTSMQTARGLGYRAEGGADTSVVEKASSVALSPPSVAEPQPEEADQAGAATPLGPPSSRGGGVRGAAMGSSSMQVRMHRWQQRDMDERFDRTSVHHPEFTRRMLHGASVSSVSVSRWSGAALSLSVVTHRRRNTSGRHHARCAEPRPRVAGARLHPHARLGGEQAGQPPRQVQVQGRAQAAAAATAHTQVVVRVRGLLRREPAAHQPPHTHPHTHTPLLPCWLCRARSLPPPAPPAPPTPASNAPSASNGLPSALVPLPQVRKRAGWAPAGEHPGQHGQQFGAGPGGGGGGGGGGMRPSAAEAAQAQARVFAAYGDKLGAGGGSTAAAAAATPAPSSWVDDEQESGAWRQPVEELDANTEDNERCDRPPTRPPPPARALSGCVLSACLCFTRFGPSV